MYSGRFAAVNGVGNVAKWQITETVEEDIVRNSATRGGTSRIFCGRDSTGSVECDGGLPFVLPGETFTFVGYTSPTSGVYGTAGMRYTVSAMCTQITVVWDYGTNKAVRHTIQFGGMGALVVASGAAVLDSTNVKAICSRGCAMVYGAAIDFCPTRTSVTLTMTSAVTVRGDASTSGWKTREAGPLDWNLAVTYNGHDKLFAPGTLWEDLKLAINSTPDSFWFNDAIVGQSTDITLTADGTAIDTQTLNIHMSSADAAGVVGFIRRPGELVANYWPIAP